jgi:hypothetical protein
MTESKSNPQKPGGLEQERRVALEAFQDALFSPAESSEIAEKREDEIDLEFENEKLSLENRKEKTRLRRRWNGILTLLVVSGFFMSYLFVVLIGFGIMNFDDNAFAVPSVVASGIVGTYGLAKLAIEYFFSEDSDKSKNKRGR